ncbi:MAG: prepilin-type N-terminal cleavage/methylation domain-containing protein [gamma proteobacterium endosymbiont of Lamellibrachia anaximandri]|nr:prepilin-type N-terminal cleavage/methylation domain-containing protein [gamma proteobacterium endosymbiont of Lamellibrachia anaximandri]
MKVQCDRRVSQKGFTLIEVLVAFVILAMSLSVLFRIFSGGLGNISMGERYAGAVTLAETLLDEANLSQSEMSGSRSGSREDGYRWIKTVQAYEVFDRDGNSIPVENLQKVEVQITWEAMGRERHMVLSTLRGDRRKY